jgi:hypothetical protein
MMRDFYLYFSHLSRASFLLMIAGCSSKRNGAGKDQDPIVDAQYYSMMVHRTHVVGELRTTGGGSTPKKPGAGGIRFLTGTTEATRPDVLVR